MANLEQSPNALVQMQALVPTLLQASTICAVKSDRVEAPRLLSAQEHMLAMGWPAHDPPNFGIDALARAINSLSASEINSLAGNGMHVAVCGAALLYVLSCTELIDEAGTP